MTYILLCKLMSGIILDILLFEYFIFFKLFYLFPWIK